MLSFGNLGNVPGRPTIVITGGIHAREWAATEMAYLIAEYLIANYAAPVAPNPRRQRIRDLVNYRNIHFIPMVNPDGNRRTVFGNGPNDRLWRKNRPAPLAGPDLARPARARRGRYPAVRERAASTAAPGAVRRAQLRPARYPAGRAAGLPEPCAAQRRDRRRPQPEHAHDSLGIRLRAEFRPVESGGNPVLRHPPGGRAGDERPFRWPWRTPREARAGNIAVALDYHSYGQFILYPGEVACARASPPCTPAPAR